MDAPYTTPAWNIVYSLWHIPSSTLLVTTFSRAEAGDRVRTAVRDGIRLDDLMLQITDDGELIGRQHLGARIHEALHDTCAPPKITL